MGKKYRIILMSDDQSVRRYKFNSRWFWLGLFTFFFLLVVAVAAGYGVYVLYHQNMDLKRQVDGLESELHAKNLELEHLHTVKKFFEANDPEELMALLGNADGPGDSAPGNLVVSDAQNQLDQEVDAQQVSVKNVSLKLEEGGLYRVDFDLSVIEEGTQQTGQIELELISGDNEVHDIDIQSGSLSFAQ